MGAYLRAARRRRRVSIERAAEETRIRADFLMRMESDEFDFLAPAYVRGFLKTYTRYLRVDAEPLLEEFDRRFGRVVTDPMQIVGLNRRSRKVPKERRKVSRWGIAAIVATGGLAALAAVGLLQPDKSNNRPSVATQESPTPSPEPTITPTPSPTETTEEIALTEGMDVEITGTRDRCWVSVSADGEDVFTGFVEIGDEVGPFHAEESMDIVLGNAYGVDLIVNGQTISKVGGQGEVLTIKLPDDIEALL